MNEEPPLLLDITGMQAFLLLQMNTVAFGSSETQSDRNSQDFLIPIINCGYPFLPHWRFSNPVPISMYKPTNVCHL